MQLHFIQVLQDTLRGPFLDTFFLYWNYVDSLWFILFFTALITYFVNRKEGISLLFLFLLSYTVNAFLKELFHLPRPCQIDPTVGLLCFSTFGFPSGAAQMATIVAGVALFKCQKSWEKILALVFAITLCFSRIYLGVHFPTDILGGIGVGIVLLFIYLKGFPLFKNHPWQLGGALSLLSFVLGGSLSQIAVTLGMGVGLFLSKNSEISASLMKRILSFSIVVLGVFFLMHCGEVFPQVKPITTFLAGLLFVYTRST